MPPQDQLRNRVLQSYPHFGIVASCLWAHTPQPKYPLPHHRFEYLTEHASVGHTAQAHWGADSSCISSVCSEEQALLLSLGLFSLHFFLPFAAVFSLETVGIIPWHSCDSATPRCYAPHLTGTFNWCQVSKTFQVRIPWGHSSLLPCLPTKYA